MDFFCVHSDLISPNGVAGIKTDEILCCLLKPHKHISFQIKNFYLSATLQTNLATARVFSHGSEL